MARVTNTNTSLSDALEAARKDQATLQKYLWIPLGIYASANAGRGEKRLAAPALADTPRRQPPPQLAITDKQGGKKNPAGKGKRQQEKGNDSKEKGSSWGSGKQSPAAGSGGWKQGASMYTTGKPRRRKCIPFQKGNCQNKSCTFAHVCFVCNEKHGQADCDRKPQ